MTRDEEIIAEWIDEWVCANYGASEAEEPSWSIWELATYLSEKLEDKKELKYVGCVSVDSGTILVADPCYWIKPNGDWNSFCNEIGTDSVHKFKHSDFIDGKGICFANFGGDGVYPVYVEHDDEGFQTRIVIDLKGE